MRLTAGSIGSEGTTWSFEFKPIWLFRIMNGYNLTVSAASALALMALLYFAARRGVLKLEPAGIWLAIGFALLYLAIPSKLLGTSFADLRVIPAAALIIPAFCSLSLPNRRWTIAALTAVTGITLANLAVVFMVWLSYRADYAAIIESFHKIDRGSLVLVGGSGDGEDPPFNDLTQYPMAYAPTLAVHYANAFVPNVFTEVGKQPVRAARRRPASRHPLWRADADTRACRDRGGPDAVRHSAFHPHLVPGLRLSLCARAARGEPAARPAGGIGQVRALCSL